MGQQMHLSVDKGWQMVWYRQRKYVPSRELTLDVPQLPCVVHYNLQVSH